MNTHNHSVSDTCRELYVQNQELQRMKVYVTITLLTHHFAQTYLNHVNDHAHDYVHVISHCPDLPKPCE